MKNRTNDGFFSRIGRAGGAAGLVAGVVLLAGCDGGIFGSSNPRPTIQAVRADQDLRAFDARGGPRFLRFEGNITTPTRCQQLRAKLDRFSESNGVIDLFVEATAVEPCPNEEETVWNYLGNLQDVDPGTYSVTIEHRFKDQDKASEVVFDGQVEIQPR